MQTINERLAALPGILKYDTPAALAKACGLDPNSLRKAMQGPSKPSFDVLEAIMKNHPQLDPDWLLLGKGFARRDICELPLLQPSSQTQAVTSATATAEPAVKMEIIRDTPELAQVKSERDQLRRYVETLLSVIAGKPSPEIGTTAVAAGGKIEASADAADIRDTVDEVAADYPLEYSIVACAPIGYKPRHLQLA